MQKLPFKRLFVKVDVIIAVYNAESTIEETVQSAIHQVIPDHLINQLCGFNSAHDRLFNSKGIASSSEEEGITDTVGGEDTSSNGASVHFDICVCCYNDASTDKSLEIIQSLEKERTWIFSSSKTSTVNEAFYDGTMQTRLLIGTAPTGTMSRGAGYARNQAVKLRDSYETTNANNGVSKQEECSAHFLCILDSDDIMHPTRIAEQASTMLSLGNEQRQKTLMGCQFDRIPKDSTQHYSQWANSLSNERLYLEQFRECTLLQPTWFLSKTWFERLGGYLEAPASDMDETNRSKRAKIDPGSKGPDDKKSEVVHDDTVAIDTDGRNKQFYRLFHPSEILDSTITNDATDHEKRKLSTHEEKPPTTLRLAEDSRFFHAHLHAGGRLHLHRTSPPLVSYRHRSGMSQSSNTPRKLLLKLRTKAWEDLVFHGNTNDSCSDGARTQNSTKWASGFAIWSAGRDGKDFLKALSPACRSKVVCFVDVDQRKIEKIKWYENRDLGLRIPILHFSVLAKNKISEQVTSFGRIDKKCGDDDFNHVSKHREQTKVDRRCETPSLSKTPNTKKKKTPNSIDPEVLQQLPVAVCVAMYRTNGALESNVASIDRVEGEDLWHII